MGGARGAGDRAVPRRRETAPDAADSDSRQRQLTRMGNAAGGAGLALLMDGKAGEASEWLHRAAERYRESIADAPPGSWGRPIGAMKALVLADDWPAAEDAARWALELECGRGRVADRALRRQPCASHPRSRRGGPRPGGLPARARRLSVRRGRRSRDARRVRPAGLHRLRSRPCSSRSRPARSTSRTSRSPTPCSCSRRSRTRRDLAAELASPLLPNPS